MPFFTKESLEELRQKTDLVEVLSSHLDLKRSGAAYKGLCPFHDEKTPSFMIQKGDTHYHCFGCGAHGDAISFLMNHVKLGFNESVETLASKFNVVLELAEGEKELSGPSKPALRESLSNAAEFFHFYLLYTPEGREALKYLAERNIDLPFIKRFGIGLAPPHFQMTKKVLNALRHSNEVITAAGLGTNGRDFFSDRITFPIKDASGAVIGFSARKFKEDTFGGKYINTQETALFKKSKVLFGLNESRRRIAKERQAIIVEGQIDALRLIYNGFNITVASQGTAFGEQHAKELINLGVEKVYLAFDGDVAGQEAAVKVGDLFIKQGVEVLIVQMPQGQDPDAVLRIGGKEKFQELLDTPTDFLSFLVGYESTGANLTMPAVKNRIADKLATMIRSWEQPLLVHESLKKLADLLMVPDEVIGIGAEPPPNIYAKKKMGLFGETIDPDKILEVDFLRLLLIAGTLDPTYSEVALRNILPAELKVLACRKIYERILEKAMMKQPCDLLTLCIEVQSDEAQKILSTLMDKKVNREKLAEHFLETVQKLLNRSWLQRCEEIRVKIQSGSLSEEALLPTIKEYNDLRLSAPKVIEEERLKQLTGAKK